jgi:hypothetical protein
MPPSVPAGTWSQVVMSRGSRLLVWPNSLETVSAAASANAADMARSQASLPCERRNHPAQIAATPKLASTCEAFRPSPGSAVPKVCFRWYPKRVAGQVKQKTLSSTRTAAGPTPANIRKQTTAPAIAPEVVTPRVKRASPENTRVTTTAATKFDERANCAMSAKFSFPASAPGNQASNYWLLWRSDLEPTP